MTHSTESVWLIIALMSCITFAMRFAFLTNYMQSGLSKPVKEFLSFTAPAVLTAMWAPIVFMPEVTEQHEHLSVNPYLVAGVFTIGLSLITQRTMVIVAAGMAAFVGLTFFQ